jgi:hypothetical protein
MTLRINLKSARYVLIATATTLLPLTCFAKPKPIVTTDILQHLRKGEPWDRGVFAATKMVMFQQAASGDTDATSVAKITLSYFTSTDCTAANGTIVPTYTTPDGTSFTINTTTPFSMVAASAWNVGSSKVSPAVADMTQIQSIAVTLRSTNNNTPQASFTGISFACVPVLCGSGECTAISGTGTQSFTLKITTAIGDPADGGVIACMNGGLNNLVVPKTDYNNGTVIVWATNPGGVNTSLGDTARSTTDGATNTTVIVNCLSNGTCPSGVTVPTQTAASNYAAGVCSTYSAAGGFTSGWFLPAGRNSTSTGQLNCLYTNRFTIGGFTVTGVSYWSSSEFNATLAGRQNFSAGQQVSSGKENLIRVRCSRAFTP